MPYFHGKLKSLARGPFISGPFKEEIMTTQAFQSGATGAEVSALGRRSLQRTQYKEPKLIPEDLACGQDEPSEDASASGVAMVVKVAREKVVLPALAHTDPDAYVAFVAELSEEFAGFMQTLSALHDAGAAVRGEGPSINDRRRGFFAGCLVSAAHLRGEAGVANVRAGLADALFAFQIVERFPAASRLLIPDDKEDLEDVSNYNFALDWLDALLVCLYESRSVEVAPGIVDAVVTYPREVAELLLDCATKAAARRQVPIEFDVSALQSVWAQPTADLIAYLEHRAPALITDDLRTASERNERFNALAARVAQGESIARPALIERARAVTPCETPEDISRWAKTLAEDLSHFRD